MSDKMGCKKNGESEVKTSISIHTYVFKWRIENFPAWPDSFKITSDAFKPANYIALYASFERFKATSGSIESYLRILSNGKTSIQFEIQNAFVDSKGKEFFKADPRKCECNDQNIICSTTVNCDSVIGFSKSTKDQIVIFKSTMKFKRLDTENVHRFRFKTSTDHLHALSEDFKAMYVDSECTDFILHTENSALRVHKFVLSARSPVLAKMLKSPMEEKEKDAIEITDIELSILRIFIEFLYTGNIPTDIDFETWCKLYYAADKYDVPSLRQTCADALLDKLDAGNSCRVLSLANRHSDVPFVDVVLDFMQSNFDAVMETEAWFELAMSEPELTNRVMRLRVQKSKKSTSN